MNSKYLCVIIHADDLGQFAGLESRVIFDSIEQAKVWDSMESAAILASAYADKRGGHLNKFAWIYPMHEGQSVLESEKIIEKIWRRTLSR